jgi:colicin import membrane protein
MSGSPLAFGAIVVLAALCTLDAPVRANEAAHKMAERFAGETGSEAKTKAASEAGNPAAETSAAEETAEADRKRETRRKVEAQRKTGEAKRRAAAKAAEQARRAAQDRDADEAEMLARARREAEEMRAAEEHAKLAEEARRLIAEAEKQRGKAEELLANEGERQTQGARSAGQQEAGRASDARPAKQPLPEAEEPPAQPPMPAPPQPQPAEVPQARPPVATAGAAPAAAAILGPQPAGPAQPTPRELADTPAPEAEAAPAAAPVSPPAPAISPPEPGPEVAVAAQPDSPPPPPAAETRGRHQPSLAHDGVHPPQVARAPGREVGRAVEVRPPSPAHTTYGHGATRFTVLLTMEPGTYGIRRRGPKVADPLLCVREGCYISTGPDSPAVFMPGRMATGIGNTLGARAGACRRSLGCVFRDVDLGPLPALLQPVDLHIFKHDRRPSHLVREDSACRREPGRIFCRHGIYADTYTLWVVPESIALAAGPAALQRAIAEGLGGPRSAELTPR